MHFPEFGHWAAGLLIDPVLKAAITQKNGGAFLEMPRRGLIQYQWY